MNSFTLSVVAIDRICYRGNAVACTVVSTTGSRTFEAHHEPFVAVLSSGNVSVLEEGGRRLFFAVENGLARFHDNACDIIATTKH